MVDKRESYSKEDLIASGRGELFGQDGPPPSGNMLMMDRIIKMTKMAAPIIKALSKQNSISSQIYGSLIATSSMILLCQVA